jgi:hypothetical protein
MRRLEESLILPALGSRHVQRVQKKSRDVSTSVDITQSVVLTIVGGKTV